MSHHRVRYGRWATSLPVHAWTFPSKTTDVKMREDIQCIGLNAILKQTKFRQDNGVVNVHVSFYTYIYM